MSIFKAPTPPNATDTSNAQFGYNQNAAGSQARINMVDQNTPFGSLNYSQTGTAADGTPQFTSSTSYTPQVQALLDKGFANAGSFDGGAATAKNLSGMWENLQKPIFAQQDSNLDAKLASQGITQGSEAYNNAQNLKARNQNDARTNFDIGAQGTAFNEALQSAGLPASMLAALTGSVNPGFRQTPQEQIQPPNYAGAVEQNYQQQTASHNAMLNGLFGIAGAGLGGWARGGFGGAGGGSGSSPG